MFNRFWVALIILFSISAFATHYSGAQTYYVQYYFTLEASGKKIQSVIVHTGVLQTSCRGGNYWNNVQDVQMNRHEDHFNARLILLGQIDSGCDNAKAPIVQYWITFEDGSKMITSEEIIPVQDLGHFEDGDPMALDAKVKAKQTLETAPDANQTEAFSIATGHAS